MSYVLTKSNEVKLNMWKLLAIFLFALVVLKPLLFPTKSSNKITEPYGSMYALPYAMHKNTEDYYPKDSKLLFANNKCCKSCCKNLWPLPFDVDDCKTCKDGKEKYVASNYTCQGANGSGCICVTPNEADLLDRRGNNKLASSNVTFPNNGIEPVLQNQLNGNISTVVDDQTNGVEEDELYNDDNVVEEEDINGAEDFYSFLDNN